jgi:hypothetical protein
MNVFFLDKNPIESAHMHCDKHVVKMILEYAQLLSTAHRILDGELYIDNSSGRRIKRWKLNNNLCENTLYKATHINHPSAVWARESKENYDWLYKSFTSLCSEYTLRYGKIHATQTKLEKYLNYSPKNISNIAFTEPPQAMPEYCRIENDSVQAYRKYYINEKANMLRYTKREKPQWIIL